MNGVCDRIVNSLRGGDVGANFEQRGDTRRERHHWFLFLLLSLAFLFWRWVDGNCFGFRGLDGRDGCRAVLDGRGFSD